jgi:hypothetical protein
MGEIKHSICIDCQHLDLARRRCAIRDWNQEPDVRCIEACGRFDDGKGPDQTAKLDADKLAETAETVTRQFFDELSKMPDQTAKQDAGKLQLTLVPTQIIRDIAAVRMYGNKKYGSSDNWKNVSPQRFRDAFFRHWLAYVDDPKSIDAESGLPHLWHAACNLAFLCEMEVHDDD